MAPLSSVFNMFRFSLLMLVLLGSGLRIDSAVAQGTKSLPKAKSTKERKTLTAPEPPAPLDRSVRPAAGPAPEIRWAEAERWELPNGLKVFLVRNTKLPRVSVSLVWDYDPVAEGSKAGVSALTGEMIRSGTRDKSKEALDEAIDGLGATLSTSSNGLYASCLSRNTAPLMGLIGEMLTQPAYRAPELERLRKQSISGLESEQTNAESVAARVLPRLLYGSTHPYGEIQTQKGLESIQLQDCENFRDRYLRPNVAYLALVGDIDRATAESLTREHLGPWAAAEVPTRKYPVPTNPNGVRVVMVDRPLAVQTVIRIANTVQLVPGSPDYIPSSVMNTILGASDARLFDNLRETHGYTYGAYSSLTKDPLVGQFRAYAQVRNAVTDSAIREFFYELNRIRDTLVPADELQGVQNYLNGTFSISLQNPQTVAGFYIDQERYRMSPTYYRNYLQDLAQVDQEAVQSMARKMIQPGSSVVLCVGKGSEIAPKLRSLDSDGIIEWIDWNGETAPDPTALKLPEGTTLASVLEKYIANTGGTKNWSKVKGLRTTMAATLQGMNLEMTQTKRSKPAASLTKVRLNSSMELSSDLYFNGKMSRKSMQGTKEVDGEELAHEAMEATPLPEMVWLNGVHSKLSLAGAVMVDGQLCAKLDWKFENGTLESHVYNLQTGLKVQSIRVSKGPDGKDALSTTAYDDYRDLGKGLQVPHKVKISMGPESIEFNLTEGTLNPRLSDADFKH